MFSRNDSPQPRRISHTVSLARVLRSGIPRLRRLFDLVVSQCRLHALQATRPFGCALAVSNAVVETRGRRIRINRNRTLVTLCLCVLATFLAAGLIGCLGDTDKTQDEGLTSRNDDDEVSAPVNKFAGNATSVGNAASDSTAQTSGVPGTILLRQSDCSLAGETFTNVALTSMNGYTGTFSGTFTPTMTPNYGAMLHTLAGLTTTAGIFANGCTDRTAGVPGQQAALLAQTSKGVFVGAAIDINNNLYIGAISSAGTFTVTRLSLTNIFSLFLGDPNSEGVRQLIVPQLVASPTNGYPTDSLYTINVHPDGTFDTPVLITAPFPAFNLVVDDFNGDGKLDLGFSNQNYAGAFTVLPGAGNGTFGAPIASATVGTGTSYLTLTGDFNGDGIRDVFTPANILFGKGDGTFTLGPASPSTGATVIGDFNNDGKDDIATYSGSGISVSLGKGDGTFTPIGPTYAGLYGEFTLAVTDIDGDGNLDLVVGEGQSGIYFQPVNGQGITMFLMGNGDGTFSGAPTYPHAAGNSGSHGAFAAGDFNNDGNIDVLVPTSGQGDSVNGLELLLGNGKGVLTPQTSNTAVKPYFVAAADINGDGKLDAVTLVLGTDNSGNATFALTTLEGNGDGTFAAPVSYPVGTPPPNGYFTSTLALGDTRGTGKPDAIFSELGALYLFKNNGDGTFASPLQLDTQSTYVSLAVTDVNGDGKADIVALTAAPINGTLDTTGSLLVYLSNGDGTFAAPTTIASSLADGQDILVGDMNKDGKPDIVLLSSNQNLSTSSLTSYLGKGNGTFAAAVNSPLTTLYLVSLATADVDGDGNPDILIGACCGNTLAGIAYGKGDGTFGTNYGLSIGQSTNAVGFADLNNDGRPDLLLASNENLITSLNEFAPVSTLISTTTSLSLSPTAPAAGQTITFSATVAPGSGTGTPTGTVTFLDGTTTLGTGTLASGKASFTGSLASGTHAITASYGGDTTYAASVSTADNLTIASTPTLAPTSTQLTAAPTSATSGTTINFTAAVAETTGTATPTGTVTFSDGTTAIGTGTLTAGVTTFSTASLSVGSHNITAAYGGDTANAMSSSSTVVVTITAAVAADFSVALSPTSGSISQGASTASNLTLTPVGGFNQAVSFACSGLPTYSTCTFSPGSVTLNGTSASTSKLTIATDVTTASLGMKPLHTKEDSTSLAMLAGAAGLALLLLRRRRYDSSLRRLSIGLVVAFLLTYTAIGCGHVGPTVKAIKTPPGTSQITVTATAGSTIHTATYTLTVQ